MRTATYTFIILLIALAIGWPNASAAQSTPLHVRVIAKGAKFIGTSMGGAQVIIRDASNQKILAQGTTRGTTGDTAKIMREPKKHHGSVVSNEAAVFRTSLDVEDPTRIEVTARGPLGQPQATATASTTLWVIPDRPLTGRRGVLLELPGIAVDVLSPPAHQKLDGAPQTVVLRANVCMLCGCPITEDGLWDAERFEVFAMPYRDGQKMPRVRLEYAGEPNQFRTQLQIAHTGAFKIVVYAFDTSDGNAGVDVTTFVVSDGDAR